MTDTTSVDVTATAWTELAASTADGTSLGFQNHAYAPLLVRIGSSAPSSADAAEIGSLKIGGRVGNSYPKEDLTLANGENVYGRLMWGTGSVTVI